MMTSVITHRRILHELREAVAASPHVNVDALAAKSNLDDFAHGGAIVNKIDRGVRFADASAREYGHASLIALPYPPCRERLRRIRAWHRA